MTYDPAPHPARDIAFSHLSNDPDAPALDSETAALMRSWLGPLIEQAATWPGFLDALAVRGYGLVFRRGRLWLIEETTGRQVCTMRFLGASMRDLAARLGRPAVRPMPGHPSWGVFLLRTEH